MPPEIFGFIFWLASTSSDQRKSTKNLASNGDIMIDAKNFEKIMKNEKSIALASSVVDMPNVRILNFVYQEDAKVLYFASSKGDPKEKEFAENKNVAFTTIPAKGLAHVRVHFANVQKSKKSVFDLKDAFVSKMPWYKENIERNGANMNLYEVRFPKAMVISGPDKAAEIEV
jgi:uncharacterized pyridoxamine 5'-phosphate oxidase family protein